MSEFTPQMNATLTDLFMEKSGQVGQFWEVKDDDFAAYKALARLQLVVLENHQAGLETRWIAALTDDGRRFFLDYNQLDEEDIETLPIRETLTLTFNLRDAQEAQTYQQLYELGKDGTLFAKLHQLLTLEALLESGDVNTLLESYPEFAENLREKINLDNEARDTQQMRQVLSEIETMKALLKQQHSSQPAAIDPPRPKPNGLRPLVPLTPPEISPRQLAVPQFDVPAYEEEDSEELFVVQADEEAGRRANENFIKSLLSLQDEEDEAYEE